MQPETLRIASLLDEASTLADAPSHSEEEFQPKATLRAAMKASSLVKEITEISARLSSLMASQGEDSNERLKALQLLNSVSGISKGGGSQQDIESSITRILESTNSAVERLEKQCNILVANQRGMEEKIRKKTIDLERTSKRLDSLKHVRPAYMDEYEQLEEELQVEYERYVVRQRNVDYLKGELSSFKQAASERQNKAERSMKRMQKKFREEEIRILNGGEDYDPEDASVWRADEGGSSSKAMSSGEKNEGGDGVLSISVDEVSRSTTPRENTSFSGSERSPSEPSIGSEMTGSMTPEENDSDSNF